MVSLPGFDLHRLLAARGGSRTQDLVGRAEAAIKGGHLDEPDQLLSQAEQADVAAAHHAQQLAQQAQAAADRRLLNAADARGTRGELQARASCGGCPDDVAGCAARAARIDRLEAEPIP